MHSNNIIHRDIKARNIFIHNNEYIIGDLGVSKMGYCGITLVGTPRFTAPEIHKEEIQTFQVDMFSIGILFYKLLFNRFPFKNLDNMNLNYQSLQDKYRIDFSGREISDNCANLIVNMLVFNPRKRIDFVKIRNHPLIMNNKFSIQKEIKENIEEK